MLMVEYERAPLKMVISLVSTSDFLYTNSNTNNNSNTNDDDDNDNDDTLESIIKNYRRNNNNTNSNTKSIT